MSDATGTGRHRFPPSAPVNIKPPDIRRWIAGNRGIPGAWSFTAELPGPHVAISAVTHGNEIAGAIVLDRLLRAELRPTRGRLSLIFANIAAFSRFDPTDPTATRFVDEDLNRVWDAAILDGSRRSCELRRARELRPLIDTVDILLDLHSMTWPSDPLMVVGSTEKAARLGMAIGVPPMVVADEGHAGGRRLIDYVHFADPASTPAAVLLEAGDHWEPATVAVIEQSCARLLRHAGIVDEGAPIAAIEPAPPPRLARVTRTVTAASRFFTFLDEFRGGQVISRGNTLIAMDGEEEVRTPHDNCLLVMPTPFAPRGYTAVRLARFLG